MWGDLTKPVHTHVVIQGQWFSWTRENIEYIPIARPKELSEFSTLNSFSRVQIVELHNNYELRN